MTGPATAVRPVATFNPLPWQIAPWRDTSPVLLLTGSAGGGKSRLAAEKVHGFCKRYPGAQGLVVRKTRESMRNSTVLFLNRVVIGEDPEVRHKIVDGRFEYANDSVLTYGGMANDEQREQIRSIGAKGGVDIVWIEEANALDEDDYNEILARMRGKAASWRQIILSTNPDAPGHWINRRLIEGGEATVYYSSASDNAHNPSEYGDNLRRLTGTLRDRLALGLWVAAEGMFFEEWDPRVHVCAPFEIPKDWPRWVSVDYGFAEPFCALWYARDPQTRRVVVYRELYQVGVRDEQQADLIRERSRGERIVAVVGDPSMFAERREMGLPSIATTYQMRGVPLVPGRNNRVQGWAVVRRALAWEDGKPPRVTVMAERCPNLTRTIPAMVRDSLDPEDVADKINSRKTEDHAPDSFRYGLVAESEMQLSGQPEQRRQYGFKTAGGKDDKPHWAESAPSEFVTAGGDGKVHVGKRGWEK